MGGIFSTIVYSKIQTLCYHQTIYGARNPAYCKCAVIASGGVLGLKFSSTLFQSSKNYFIASIVAFVIVMVLSVSAADQVNVKSIVWFVSVFNVMVDVFTISLVNPFVAFEL